MNKPQLTTTELIDPVFVFIFGICLALLIAITVAMVLFVVRYHRSRAPQPTSQADGNLWLELLWTLLPTILVLAMFYYGWVGYRALREVPPGALPVTATARMWSWNFSYANGATSPKLYVPAGRPVKVALESRDVLHGFFIPAFRVKRDVVPGMANHVWFVAPRPGSYDIFCSQFCGTGHSAMLTTVEALPEPEFTAWLSAGEKRAMEGSGRTLLDKHGCLGCHSLDGSRKVGPSLKGVFGKERQVLKQGQPVTIEANEAYLAESIRTPAAAVVEGFPPVMPGYGHLSDQEIAALVDFIRGLQ